MQQRPTSPTRRTFIRSIAAAGVAAPIAWPALVRAASPNGKLNIAGIGVGGMGYNNLHQMAHENIVALCDVDQHFSARAYKLCPKATPYKNFRVMFDKQHKDIDAVLIAVPDHDHAIITLAAMQLGKGVYCQKPLTHDLWEARQITQAAAKAGVVTQMGNQFHSCEGMRLTCEWIWDGAIGNVRQVDAWCSLKYTPFGHAYWSTLLNHRPTAAEHVAQPAGLDWDTWIGPAPYRPYHPTYHPARWRAWWDFGSGMMGDRGVHTLDSVFWSLHLTPPEKVELIHREGGNDEIHPDVAHVRYHVPARGDLPPVVINWYEGTEPPRPGPDVLEPGRRMGDPEGGVIYHGDKGALMHGVYPASPRLIPEKAMQAYKRPAPTLPRIHTTHEQHFIDCCKSGQRGSSDIATYAGPLTEFVLLGNLAIRLGGEIKWDSKNLKAIGRPEADEWIRRPRRKGWELAV